MAEINLTQYGITGTTEIVHNPSYELLYEEETKADLTGYEKGQESELGAVNVKTGVYTGRSPKDKYIVMDENSNVTGKLADTLMLQLGYKRVAKQRKEKAG